MHAGIMVHFASNNLAFQEGREAESINDFATLPWQLVKMSKRGLDDVFVMKKDTGLLAAHITLQTLKTLTKCQNPGANASQTPHWVIISLSSFALCH